MKKCIVLALLPWIWVSPCAGDEYADEAKAKPAALTQPVFPVLAPGQTTYVIQENEASGLTIDTLKIPDGVTLSLAPGVTAIDWTVREVRFGKGATIDLSAPTGKPAKAANGSPPPPQPGYCKIILDAGDNGRQGVAGAQGRSLTLRSIRRIVLRGSLWIKTDGGPGGDGGDGGQGQQGGGPRKTVLNPCDAAGGGKGGAGGNGGAGGATSPILLTFTGNAPDIRAGASKECGTSTRPNGATGDAGALYIWGHGGCGGAGGAPGPGGLPGGEGAHYGPAGPGGQAGSDGYRSDVRILERQ